MKKKVKKSKNSSKGFFNKFKENYQKSWRYLLETKKFIWFIVVLFFITALIGFIFPAPESVLEKILELIQDILKQTQDLSWRGLFAYIFLNNFKVSLLGMVAGIFLGIMPVLTAAGNGYLLGFVGRYSVREAGFFSLWKILPHGIFELPAVFISLGLGVRLGMVFFKGEKEKFATNFYEALRVFFFIVLPLLFVAAIIETALIFFFA